MIPMAYSKYFLDARNITNNSSILNTNYSSSNNIDLGNNSQKKKEWFELQIEAEPIVINQFKKKMKKKRRCEIICSSNPIRKKKENNQLNQSNNQFLSEEFVYHSNHVVPPIEVSSAAVMSSNLRGETILMASHCSLSLSRNSV
jgi:hypothetical protein